MAGRCSAERTMKWLLAASLCVALGSIASAEELPQPKYNLAVARSCTPDQYGVQTLLRCVASHPLTIRASAKDGITKGLPASVLCQKGELLLWPSGLLKTCLLAADAQFIDIQNGGAQADCPKGHFFGSHDGELSIIGAAFCASIDPAPTKGTLVFPLASKNSVALTSPTQHKILIAELIPEQDVSGNTTVISLSIRKQSGPLVHHNLLEPADNWHGYQPFNFAASDFKRGAMFSMFGPSRIVRIPTLGDDLVIKVTDAAVTQSNGAQCCSFERLTLSLAFVHDRTSRSPQIKN